MVSCASPFPPRIVVALTLSLENTWKLDDAALLNLYEDEYLQRVFMLFNVERPTPDHIVGVYREKGDIHRVGRA